MNAAQPRGLTRESAKQLGSDLVRICNDPGLPPDARAVAGTAATWLAALSRSGILPVECETPDTKK
jgi:hypothetical protein